MDVRAAEAEVWTRPSRGHATTWAAQRELLERMVQVSDGGLAGGILAGTILGRALPGTTTPN